MKVSLIVFSAFLTIAGTASAGDYALPHGGTAVDASKSVPGIGDAIYSPNNLQDPKVSVKGWGTGKGDAKRKLEIGETEKNLHRAPPPAATPINLP